MSENLENVPDTIATIDGKPRNAGSRGRSSDAVPAVRKKKKWWITILYRKTRVIYNRAAARNDFILLPLERDQGFGIHRVPTCV